MKEGFEEKKRELLELVGKANLLIDEMVGSGVNILVKGSTQSICSQHIDLLITGDNNPGYTIKFGTGSL